MMNRETTLNFIVGIWGRMQLAMKETGLVVDGGVAIKPYKHMDRTDREAIEIYNILDTYLRSNKIFIDEIVERSRVTDNIVKKLINDHKRVNNQLLAMFLYQEYLLEFGSHGAKTVTLPKVKRQIEDFPLTTEELKTTWKYTGRIADNMWRQFTGKAQLSDEVRDLRAKRIKL